MEWQVAETNICKKKNGGVENPENGLGHVIFGSFFFMHTTSLRIRTGGRALPLLLLSSVVLSGSALLLGKRGFSISLPAAESVEAWPSSKTGSKRHSLPRGLPFCCCRVPSREKAFLTPLNKK